MPKYIDTAPLIIGPPSSHYWPSWFKWSPWWGYVNGRAAWYCCPEIAWSRELDYPQSSECIPPLDVSEVYGQHVNRRELDP